MSTPVVFGPDRLRADLVADFALRGVLLDVEVGTWKTRRLRAPAGALVVIGLGRANYDSSADTMHGVDKWIDLGDDTVAAAKLARVQTFPIWVHAIAPDSTAREHVEQAAREATLALADATAAAVERTRYGLPLFPWPAEVEDEESGEFVFGSVMRIEAKIAIPVFDDPSPTATPARVDGENNLDLGDEDVAPDPAETVTEEEA